MQRAAGRRDTPFRPVRADSRAVLNDARQPFDADGIPNFEGDSVA